MIMRTSSPVSVISSPLYGSYNVRQDLPPSERLMSSSSASPPPGPWGRGGCGGAVSQREVPLQRTCASSRAPTRHRHPSEPTRVPCRWPGPRGRTPGGPRGGTTPAGRCRPCSGHRPRKSRTRSPRARKAPAAPAGGPPRPGPPFPAGWAPPPAPAAPARAHIPLQRLPRRYHCGGSGRGCAAALEARGWNSGLCSPRPT